MSSETVRIKMRTGPLAPKRESKAQREQREQDAADELERMQVVATYDVATDRVLFTQGVNDVVMDSTVFSIIVRRIRAEMLKSGTHYTDLNF